MMKTPDALSLADKTIRDEAKQIGANRMLGSEWIGNIALFLFAVVSSLLLMFHIMPSSRFEQLAVIFVLIPLMSILVKTGIAWARESMADRQFIKLLRTDYPQLRQNASSAAIAPLLFIMSFSRSDDLFPTLVALLHDLLKSLKEEDAVVLTQEHRQVLHKLVGPGSQVGTVARCADELEELERHALRPALVKALAWLGNASSLPVLENLSECTDDPELRQAALQSLAQIHQRLQARPGELLRASAVPDRPETLLRATLVETPQNSSAKQLLRASNIDAERQGKSTTPRSEE